MTGLLLKDILYLKRQLKMLLIIFAFYAVLLVTTGSHIEQFNAIFITLIVMLPMLIITNSFAYDELSKWDIYSLSLPVTKGKIVLCKYQLTSLMTCLAALFPLAVNALSGNTNPETLAGIYAAFFAALVLCGILIPLFYKFGTQKARIALLAIVMVPTLGTLLLKNMKVSMPGNAEIEFWLKLSPVFLIPFFVGSYFVSRHIFQNKEI